VDFLDGGLALVGGIFATAGEDQADVAVHVKIAAYGITTGPGLLSEGLARNGKGLGGEGINGQEEKVSFSTEAEHNLLGGPILDL